MTPERLARTKAQVDELAAALARQLVGRGAGESWAIGRSTFERRD
jgi:hypothetical protein